MRIKRRVSNIVLVAILSISIIFQTFYIDHLKVQAAEAVVGGVVAGETLLEFIIGVAAIGLCAYCGYQSEDIYGDSSPLQIGREFANWTNTVEGSMALKDYTNKLDWEVIQGGKGGPEPPQDPLNTEIVGIAYDVALMNLLSQFYSYLEDNGKLDYLDQDVTVNSVLPDYIHVGERLSFNDSAALKSFPDVFSDNSYYCSIASSITLQNNWYYDLRFTSSYDTEHFTYYYFYEDGNSPRAFVTYAYREGSSLIATYRYDSDFFDSFNLGRVLQEYSIFPNNASGSMPGYSYALPTFSFYVSGNFFYEALDGTLYYVDAQGKIYDEAGNVIASSLTTEEGYLKSAKPIVGKNLSGFHNKLSESITEVLPESPVLTKQQINNIYDSVSNYYENVTHNYYEDTTYIEGDTYIEEVTNIFNEVVESPSSPPYVPDIPGLSDNYRVVGLDSVFPFCIPFDIYELVSIFAADPVAPSFDWTFYLGDLGEYTINVDLSVFDPIAEIVRTFEFFIFMLSILILTRDNMIKG